MALFSKFFGRTISEAAAFALGGAIRSPLEPPLVELTNETWSKFVDGGVTIPTDAGAAAEIAAEDVASIEWAKNQAKQRGIGGDQMDKLIGAVLNAPGVPQLLTLWRRGEIKDADFLHGLRKAKLEGRWDAPLQALKTERLDPSVIALGIVRSVINDPGLLVTTLDTSDSNVPPYKPLQIDALEEAAANGIDRERLRGMVGEIGLPMPVVRAANAFFRGILTRGAYNLAVLEGDTRPEWGDAILEEARQILSAHEWAELRLRAWVGDDEFYAGAAQHGMSQENADHLLKVLGRPLSFHQAFIGARRGGTLGGDVSDIPPYFLRSLQESNIRPEWYSLAWAQRFNYPTAFVLRALTEAGDLSQAETEQILLYEGWEPSLAAKVSTRWAGTVAKTPTNKQIAGAQTKLITATHKAYIGGALDDAAAHAQLEGAGLDAETITGVLYYWSQEKQLENLP